MPKRDLSHELDILTSGVVSTGLELVSRRKKKKKLRGGIIPALLATAIPMLIDYGMRRHSENKQRQAEADQARADYLASVEEQKRRDAELEAERNQRFQMLEDRKFVQNQIGDRIAQEKQQSAAQRVAASRRRQGQHAAEQSRVSNAASLVASRQNIDSLRARNQNELYAMEDMVAQAQARQTQAARRQQSQAASMEAQRRQIAELERNIGNQEETYGNLFDVEREQALQTIQAQQRAAQYQTRGRPSRVVAKMPTTQRRR